MKMGRDWMDEATSQGTPGHPGAGRGRKHPPPEPSEEHSPAHTWFQICGTVRSYCFQQSNHLVQQPQETNSVSSISFPVCPLSCCN